VGKGGRAVNLVGDKSLWAGAFTPKTQNLDQWETIWAVRLYLISAWFYCAKQKMFRAFLYSSDKCAFYCSSKTNISCNTRYSNHCIFTEKIKY